jgi:2-oxo-4-hydroxy-4-carboxy--5-ureidoimidazoline (OHCU) decarboxylase
MALFKDHYKYVASPDDGQHELYDLDADPRELENLIEKRPDLAARFSAELEAWLSAHPERRATGLIEMGPHDWEVFRALGYAGGDDE